eukprot:900098-Alexandrium_andersonii.AAC.1
MLRGAACSGSASCCAGPAAAPLRRPRLPTSSAASNSRSGRSKRIWAMAACHSTVSSPGLGLGEGCCRVHVGAGPGPGHP